jgi:hypothetical protein
MSGGSARTFTDALCAQSQAKNPAKTSQNTVAQNLEFITGSYAKTRRRTRTPISDPRKAMGTQIQPCRLPVEMPLTMAPMLQPKARREL